MQTSERDSFYAKAIEWTHRADKVINLVLGYLLAIAAVLGFMDVLSNGEVLGQVPYLFYIWLAIMGLGVDFQILLVIGRIPDLAKMAGSRWAKGAIFAFNIVFLAFLCYMSVIIAAVFTQHRDAAGSIAQAMQALGIDSTRFVYERAALATLLLVLMAVDRTMERWRMQVQPGQAEQVLPATIPAAIAPETLNLLIERLNTLTVTVQQISSTPAPVPQIEAPKTSEPLDTSLVGNTPESEQGAIEADTEPIGGLPSVQSYADQIEELYKANTQITAVEIEKQLGCSRTTAAKWLQRVKQAQ